MGFYWAKANTMACFRRAIDADPLPLTALARATERAGHLRAHGAGLCPREGRPRALLRPWYNKRVLDLSCVREHDDLLFSPRADGGTCARVRLPAAVLRLSRGRNAAGGCVMRCFDGHCDTLARCMATGEGCGKTPATSILRAARPSGSTRRSSPCLPTAQRQMSRSIPSHSGSTRCWSANARAMPISSAAAARRDVRAAWAAGKTAALLGIEGAELLDCNPRRLDDAAAWECVYVTLTWNHANALAGSHCDAPMQGLTAPGRAFVRALYAHRMLPDVYAPVGGGGVGRGAARAWPGDRFTREQPRRLCAHAQPLGRPLFAPSATAAAWSV